jgi:ribonuclease HI
MNISVYTDGGARGNPGPAGYGLVILDENNNLIFEDSKYLGFKTNNEAEYSALLGALSWIKANKESHDIRQITFYSDSQLLVRQIQGSYKVKAAHLKEYHRSVINLLNEISLNYSFQDIRRGLNTRADELANQAMDRRC